LYTTIVNRQYSIKWNVPQIIYRALVFVGFVSLWFEPETAIMQK